MMKENIDMNQEKKKLLTIYEYEFDENGITQHDYLAENTKTSYVLQKRDNQFIYTKYQANYEIPKKNMNNILQSWGKYYYFSLNSDIEKVKNEITFRLYNETIPKYRMEIKNMIHKEKKCKQILENFSKEKNELEVEDELHR